MANLLDVQDVVCAFGSFRALDGVSLRVADSEIHGIIGPNGAGKSTLFNAITGAVRLEKGDIRLSGRSILGLATARIYRFGVARTFQSVRVFSEWTALDHVLLSSDVSSRASPGDAQAALSAVGLGGWMSSARVEEFSHAERKRLCIAMCLAGRPSLLLLDEPAAGLEETETREFGEMLTKIYQKYELSIMLVEHKLKFVMGLCHSVSVLDYGRVIASAAPEEVARDTKVIEAYLGTSDYA